MANKRLPSGRRASGRTAASIKTLTRQKISTAGVAISELPAAAELTGNEIFPVVQGKETMGASVDQIRKLIPAGDKGESAYALWVLAQPEGSDTSEAAYLEFQKGKVGEPGTGIKSVSIKITPFTIVDA